MIKNLLETYFLNNKRLGLEHKDSLYATFASCDKILNNENGITKHQGHCQRAAYYSCNGLGASERKLNHSISSKMGDSIEGLLIYIFSKLGVLYEKGVKFSIPKHNVNGRLDAILLYEEKKVGLEIKTLSSSQWTNNKIFGSKWNDPFPKLDHLLQCVVYLYAFLDEIDTFKLLYVRRDNGEIKEFSIQLALIDGILYPTIDGVLYQDINCKNIFEKFDYLNTCLENDTLPKRSYSIEYTDEEIEILYTYNFISKIAYDNFKKRKFGDFECTNCSYRDICIKDGE